MSKESKDPGPEDPALISPRRGVVIGFRYIVLVLVLVLVLEQNHASSTSTSTRTRTNWHDIVFKIKFLEINLVGCCFSSGFQSTIVNQQSSIL